MDYPMKVVETKNHHLSTDIPLKLLKLLLDPFLARLYGDDGGVTPQHPVHNLN
jgi:hypothetical protein